MAKALTKKEIVEELAGDIAILLHTGLRKWTEDPNSSIAWRAIFRFEGDNWLDLCRLVAEEIYTPMRKAFIKKLKEEQKHGKQRSK